MAYPDIPTSDPSTEAGWREWDIYYRGFAASQEVNRQALIVSDTASRNAIAAAEQAMAAAQKDVATAMRYSADIFATTPTPLNSPSVDGNVIAALIDVNFKQTPGDWINRTAVTLSQLGAVIPAVVPK